MASDESKQTLEDAKPVAVAEYEGVFAYTTTEFKKVKEFKCRDTDIWVCSFPRSGTTLTQQTTYLIKTLDFEKATTVDLDVRFPWIEMKDDSYPYFRGVDYVDGLPESEPRMLKCHLHYHHLPKELLQQGKGKVIYIVRNPKASVPSYYKVLHFLKNPMADSKREFLELFLADKNILGCPWGLHIREYWEHRNDENVLFLQFEETIKDRPGTVRKIAEFLGVELTDENVDKIVAHTSLESMKTNKSVNMAYYETLYQTDTSEGKFINKARLVKMIIDKQSSKILYVGGEELGLGEVSGWRKDIPDDLVQLFDEKIERELGETDIKFPE